MPKGDIVLIPFPFTDLSGQKVRPALVLHSAKNSEDCIVVFISSVVKKKCGSYDVHISPSTRNGLKAKSIIKMNKVATLQKNTIIGELGKLEHATLHQVKQKLKALFHI